MTSTLGSRVAARRIELNLTQRELSARIGCTVTTLSRLELDRVKNPSQRILLALSKHLKVSLGRLCEDGSKAKA